MPPALGLKRGEDRRKKREKFYIYLDVTHTHQKNNRVKLTLGYAWSIRDISKYIANYFN
jgi:hypothetical protein